MRSFSLSLSVFILNECSKRVQSTLIETSHSGHTGEFIDLVCAVGLLQNKNLELVQDIETCDVSLIIELEV